MESTNQTQELEDKIFEELEEAINSNKSMDSLMHATGQASLSWYFGRSRKLLQARRKFFELRKVKREESPSKVSK